MDTNLWENYQTRKLMSQVKNKHKNRLEKREKRTLGLRVQILPPLPTWELQYGPQPSYGNPGANLGVKYLPSEPPAKRFTLSRGQSARGACLQALL